jgi:mono/diheme cytochrome c family protein
MMMLNIKKLSLNVAVLFILPAPLFAQQADQPPAKPSSHMESHIGSLTGHSEAGADLYYRYCWGCHGARGNGDGENAPYVTPTPRNFVAAAFKCRSTPTGTLPLDSDLFNTIGRGFNFTNMPSWAALTSQNRADLVAFIKTFSARWVTEKPGDPIVIPAEPKLTVESIKHGGELFQKLECWKCHGQEGRGDGPSASTLTDSNDQPIRPYNFTSTNRSKCGKTNSELYRIFMTGLDGTPMPSFADVVKPEDAWDLVHYLRTLQVNNASPELTLWVSTKEGAEIVNAKKVRNTYTGSGVKP